MEYLDQSLLNKSWADIVDEDELELPIPTLDQPESQHLDDSKTNATETSPEDNKHASNSLPDNNNASPKGKLVSKLANFDAEKYPHTNPWFTLTEEEKAEQTAIWEAESAERSKLPGASASRWAPGNAGKYSSTTTTTTTSTTTSFPRKPTFSSSPPASPPNKFGTAASKWATADNAPSAPKYSNKRYGDSYDRHNSKHNYSDRSNYTSPSSSRYKRNGGFDNKENFTRENRLREYYQLTNEAPEGQKSHENAQSGVTSPADANEPVEEVAPVVEEEEKKEVSVDEKKEEDVVAAKTNKVEETPRDANDGNDLLLGEQTACATNSSCAEDNDGVLNPTTTTSDNADVSAVSGSSASGPVVSGSVSAGSVSTTMTSTDGWDTTTATNNTWDSANDWNTSNTWEATTTTTTTVANPASTAATSLSAAFISSPKDWKAFALANQCQLDEKKSVAAVEKSVAVEQKKSFVNKEPVALKDEKAVASEPVVAWKEEKNVVAGWGQPVVEPVVEKKEEKPSAKTFVWGPLVEEKPVVVKPVTEELAVGWGNPTEEKKSVVGWGQPIEEKKPAVVKKPAEVSISLVDLCGGPKKPKEVFLRLSELVNTKPPREISLKLSDL